MERSEPSLAPEWLRNSGSGAGVSTSTHHFAASQADGPVLVLPKRNRSSKSIGSSDAPHSSLLERSSSSNSRRSSSSNGLAKHDKNSYSRSYSSFNRNQRDKDREKPTISDNWDLEYSDPLRSMIAGRSEDTLKRSHSMISRRQGVVPQRRITTELRNGSHNSNNHDTGNGSHSGSSVTGIPKVSFERDFPLLGSDERPKTPDIVRVSSPGLSRGIQSLSIGNSPLVGSEGWTSALAEVPTSVGCNGTGSSPALPPPLAASASASGSHSTCAAGSSLSGLNMAEALVQVPARSLSIPQPSGQLQREELAIAQSKKLIPMTPKTLVNQSDKLKPKTAVRSSDVMVAPKNGVHQLSPLQLGGQSVRGTNVRVDGPKSPSGKLLVLKAGRENGVSTVPKDVQSQTANTNNRVVNGLSAGVSSVASVPLKKPSNPKLSTGERKTSGLALNHGHVPEKQSRNDFFNSMRQKSMNGTSGAADSGIATHVEKLDKEPDKLSCAQGANLENESEVKCGETCLSVENFPRSEDDNAAIFPNEEEKAFLRSLGWDENAGDDEALTEEEINGFYQEVSKMGATSKLCRGLWTKTLSHFERSAGGGSTEPSSPASQTEA